jgi:hypothetical protein
MPEGKKLVEAAPPREATNIAFEQEIAVARSCFVVEIPSS